MGRFNSLCATIVIFIICVTFIHFTEYKEEATREFNEHNLDVSVNYAVDAAVEEMVKQSTDLKLDYADFEYSAVNPEIALQIYCEVLLQNLGYAVTDENIQMIKTNNTPCFIVACYDGYYVGKPTRINDVGARDLLFSEKKPYSYVVGDTFYSLNLGGIDCKQIKNGVVSKVNCPLTREDCWMEINRQITEDFMKAVEEESLAQTGLKHEIIIPGGLTNVAITNAVKSPSVLAYLNNIRLGPGKPIESFAIGGAKLTHTDFIGAYVRDGQKYYCPTRLKPPGVTFIKIYENAELAAQDGYFADIRYFE